MRAEDGQQVIVLEEITHGLVRVKVGAATYVVVHKVLRPALLAKVLDRVRPQNIAHQAGHRRLTESIELQSGRGRQSWCRSEQM